VQSILASGATTDAETALLRHLAALKELVAGRIDRARDMESLRTVIRALFVRVDLQSAPFAFRPEGQAQDGSVIDVGEARYWLVPVVRWEMVGPDFEPLKADVPEPDRVLTSATCR
jgi:hypothetical protein